MSKSDIPRVVEVLRNGHLSHSVAVSLPDEPSPHDDQEEPSGRSSLKKFFDDCAEKLSFPARRLFNDVGAEFDDLELVFPGDRLTVTAGESWVVPWRDFDPNKMIFFRSSDKELFEFVDIGAREKVNKRELIQLLIDANPNLAVTRLNLFVETARELAYTDSSTMFGGGVCLRLVVEAKVDPRILVRMPNIQSLRAKMDELERAKKRSMSLQSQLELVLERQSSRRKRLAKLLQGIRHAREMSLVNEARIGKREERLRELKVEVENSELRADRGPSDIQSKATAVSGILSVSGPGHAAASVGSSVVSDSKEEFRKGPVGAAAEKEVTVMEVGVRESHEAASDSMEELTDRGADRQYGGSDIAANSSPSGGVHVSDDEVEQAADSVDNPQSVKRSGEDGRSVERRERSTRRKSGSSRPSSFVGRARRGVDVQESVLSGEMEQDGRRQRVPDLDRLRTVPLVEGSMSWEYFSAVCESPLHFPGNSPRTARSKADQAVCSSPTDFSCFLFSKEAADRSARALFDAISESCSVRDDILSGRVCSGGQLMSVIMVLLGNTYTFQFLHRFLCSFHSEELVDVWRCIRLFREDFFASLLQPGAKFISDKFLRPGAVMQVNIDEDVAKEVFDALQDADAGTGDSRPLSPSLFDRVERVVLEHLVDGYAVRFLKSELFELCVKSSIFVLSGPSPTGKTAPLQMAVRADDGESLERWLDRGIGVDFQDSEGNSALHVVCNKRRARLGKVLVQHGASANLRNNAGNTPLIIAVYRNSAHCMKLCVAGLGDERMQNGYGQYPIDVAGDVSSSMLCVRDLPSFETRVQRFQSMRSIRHASPPAQREPSS